MEKLAESLLIDILSFEMGIVKSGESARIWIRNQNVKIPNDDNLFMAVGMVDAPRVLSVRNKTFTDTVDDEEVVKERQTINMLENIQVDIMSRNNDAINRRWEILAALQSVYASQVQEENAFKIFRIPANFVNTSDTEGAEKINKFSITIPVAVWYSKEKVISTPNGDWYDSFDTRVDDKDTIGELQGLIEFNIEGENIT